MSRHATILTCAVVLGCLTSCAGNEKKAAAPISTTTVSSASPELKAVSPSIAVSDGIAKQCELRFDDPGQAPKFDFDTSDLLPADRDALEQIGTCLATGPLKGHAVALIGRADPRGTTDYNLALGARRANTVASYLNHLGVDREKLRETSRGELDAKGTDETSWELDRRVDIVLADGNGG